MNYIIQDKKHNDETTTYSSFVALRMFTEYNLLI